jgi:YD repeat-containing protein
MMGYLIPRLEQTVWPYCSQTLSANPWWQQPPENSIRYSYDAQGNLRTSVDANGNTIEH